MFITRLTDCLTQFGTVLARLKDDASGPVGSREMKSNHLKEGILTLFVLIEFQEFSLIFGHEKKASLTNHGMA